jgi:hypothetical protein
VDLTPYTGLGQFGPAYRRMLEQDCHAPGSVDRLLQQRMVRLCAATAGHLYSGFTPAEARYQSGSRPVLERAAAALATMEDVAAFCAAIAERAPAGLDDLLVGGTEEQIIERGCDWCTDLARVACALCQVRGVPARIIYLADVEQAYSGHAIIEARRAGVWGAVDPTGSVVYRHPGGRPASTWDLMSDADLLMRHAPAPFTTVGQFRRAAVANYFIGDSAFYAYTVSGPNAYYRSILEMSGKGWPGGLRWLHGEDRRG